MRRYKKHSKLDKTTVKWVYNNLYHTLRKNQENQGYIAQFHRDLVATPFMKRDKHWHIFMNAYRSFIARDVIAPESEPLDLRYYTIKVYGKKLRRSFYIYNKISRLGMKIKE